MIRKRVSENESATYIQKDLLMGTLELLPINFKIVGSTASSIANGSSFEVVEIFLGVQIHSKALAFESDQSVHRCPQTSLPVPNNLFHKVSVLIPMRPMENCRTESNLARVAHIADHGWKKDSINWLSHKLHRIITFNGDEVTALNDFDELRFLFLIVQFRP